MLLLSPCFISSMSLCSLYNCSLPFLSFCSVCGKPKSNLNSQMISIFYFRCSSLLSTSSPFIVFAVLFRYTVHSHLIRHFLSWCYIWHCYFIVPKRNLVFTCNCSNLSAGNQKTLEHWGKIHYSRKKNCHQNWISAISQILCLIESEMRGWYKDSDHLKPLLTTTPYYSILINLIIHHSPQFPPPSHFTHPLFSLFLKYFFHSRASFTNFFFTFFSPCLSFPFALLIILSLNLPGFHSLCLLYDFYVLHHPPFSWLLNLHLANQEKNVLNKPRPCQRRVIQWDLSMCSIIIRGFLWPFLNWSWQCTLANLWLRSICQWQTRAGCVWMCPKIFCFSQWKCNCSIYSQSVGRFNIGANVFWSIGAVSIRSSGNVFFLAFT